MNKQNIMVHSACQFTRLGLEQAINSHPELLQKANLMHYPVPVFLPQHSPTPDILILVLGRNVTETLMIQNQIMTAPLLEGTQVVLISPRENPGWLRRYLCGVLNVQAELDAAVSVKVLQSLLIDILAPSPTQQHGVNKLPLSRRELDIIKRLLSGKSGMQVARDLGLSCKTVSAHKRNALLKLGVCSLHGLLSVMLPV